MALADSVRALEGKFKVLSKVEFRGETTLTIDRASAARLPQLSGRGR